jgi:hypothetical protein
VTDVWIYYYNCSEKKKETEIKEQLERCVLTNGDINSNTFCLYSAIKEMVEAFKA